MLEEDTKKIMDFALSKIEKGGIKMCVPTVFIREDGKGFIVRAGGIDFDVHCPDPLDPDFWRAINKEGVVVGYGSTIMSAVENTLAKVRSAESVDASIQEGKRER